MIDRGAEEAARIGQLRSPHWPTVMHEFLQAHPTCEACVDASIIHVGHQVHHIHPFHLCKLVGRPDLELCWRNLITLGETEHNQPAPDHHLLLGHLDDFKSYNTAVVRDSILFRGMSTAAIKADPRWLARERHRPADQLTADELKAFRAELDRILPPDPAVLKRFGITIH